MAVQENNSDDIGVFSSAVFSFDHIEPYVQTHLKNVYCCLSLGMLSAALGAYIHNITKIGEWNFLTTALSFAMIVWLGLTTHTKENVAKRLSIFNTFTFFSGASLGPLLDLVISIEPRIVASALLSSTLVFISLALAAMFNTDRKFLYMGGMLFSCLFLLLFIGFLNMFTEFRIIFDLYIWCSLGLFLLFVLYDTQLVIEKRRRGDEDFIWQSVALFLDAIQIFKLVLIILAKKVSDVDDMRKEAIVGDKGINLEERYVHQKALEAAHQNKDFKEVVATKQVKYK